MTTRHDLGTFDTMPSLTALAAFADCFDMTDAAKAKALDLTHGGTSVLILEAGTSASEGAPVWLACVTRHRPERMLPAVFLVLSAAFLDDDSDEPTVTALVASESYHDVVDAYREALR